MYSALKIDFEIPYILEKTINDYINDLNFHNGSMEDCYRYEIRSLLNGCDLCLTDRQIQLLRNYYQFGGIHDTE